MDVHDSAGEKDREWFEICENSKEKPYEKCGVEFEKYKLFWLCD